MSEICLDCWNNMNESKDNEKKYILSRDLDLCEGCGEWIPVIIMERKVYYIHKFRYYILPFRIIYNILNYVYGLIRYIIKIANS